MDNDSKASAQTLLASIRTEKFQLTQRLEKLAARERIILEWMDEKDGQSELPLIQRTPLVIKPRIGSFLRSVAESGKPYSNLELGQMAAAQGIIEGKVDLRSINSVMLSFKNAGLVDRRSDKWIWRSKK